ncbi:MAG: hypothetical protein ACLQK4_06970 [Acidimicrobiales bacterium]|jgi:hypothetical protein
MTWVTCRCGHGFETRAESRTTCRMCKSAVTVPRSATSVHYSGGEGASGASRPQVAMIGLGFVGWGVWSLRKWNASDPATRQWQSLGWALTSIAAGCGLLYIAACSRFWEE